jgi:hypothetical protein
MNHRDYIIASTGDPSCGGVNRSLSIPEHCDNRQIEEKIGPIGEKPLNCVKRYIIPSGVRDRKSDINGVPDDGEDESWKEESVW